MFYIIKESYNNKKNTKDKFKNYRRTRKMLGYYNIKSGGQIQIERKEFEEVYYRINHPQYNINKVYKRKIACTNEGQFIQTQLGRVYLDKVIAI